MRMASKIMRRSIQTFLQGYQSFTSIATFLVFPVSAMMLLTEAETPTSTAAFRAIYLRLRDLFEAAAFPVYSQLFSYFNLKFSQTILSSIIILPTTLTFLILAKASIVGAVIDFPRYKLALPPLSSFLPLYIPVLLTHLFNSFLLFSASAIAFFFMFLVFSIMDAVGFSLTSGLAVYAVGAILYLMVVGSGMIIGKLATVVAAAENYRGYRAFLRACVLIRGRMTTAALLGLSANLGLAAVETLFYYRVLRAYHLHHEFSRPIVWEAVIIVYLYALLMVLDVIITSMFFKDCKSATRLRWDEACYYATEMEPEDKGAVLEP